VIEGFFDMRFVKRIVRVSPFLEPSQKLVTRVRILDTSISITTPLFTHASSGPQQHNLFNWLTHSEKNIHYDYEITGPGTIFFINEQGELYGIFGPEVKFSNRVINRVLP